MKTKKTSRIIILAFLTMTLVVTTAFSSAFNLKADATTENVLYQYFLCTGQSDCTLIELNGVRILVDTGTTASATKTKAFLDRKGIDYLDYLIITHYDSDHVGGLTTILGQGTDTPIEVGTFISRKYSTYTLTTLYNKLSDTTGTYTQYINYLKVANAVARNGGMSAPFVGLSKANVIANYAPSVSVPMFTTIKNTLGSAWNWDFPNNNASLDVNQYSVYSSSTCSLKMRFIHKDTTYLTSSDRTIGSNWYNYNINNDSLVFQLIFTHSGTTRKYLYTGDIGTVAVADIMEYDDDYSNFSLRSEVLKVQHHGYIGSMTTAFANRVNPNRAIITNDDVSQVGATDLFDKMFVTGQIQSYVAAANSNHEFVAIRLTSSNVRTTIYAAYYDTSSDTLGSVPIISYT